MSVNLNSIEEDLGKLGTDIKELENLFKQLANDGKNGISVSNSKKDIIIKGTQRITKTAIKRHYKETPKSIKDAMEIKKAETPKDNFFMRMIKWLYNMIKKAASFVLKFLKKIKYIIIDIYEATKMFLTLGWLFANFAASYLYSLIITPIQNVYYKMKEKFFRSGKVVNFSDDDFKQMESEMVSDCMFEFEMLNEFSLQGEDLKIRLMKRFATAFVKGRALLIDMNGFMKTVKSRSKTEQNLSEKSGGVASMLTWIPGVIGMAASKFQSPPLILMAMLTTIVTGTIALKDNVVAFYNQALEVLGIVTKPSSEPA